MNAVTLCACGKPRHKGMCSARWAVRKANNGPSGIRAREADSPVALPEAEIARRLFGDLADDVLLLRKHGRTVARFKDQFRVGGDVVSAERLTAMAGELRKASRGGPKVARSAGGSDVVSVENAREGSGAPSNQNPPAVADDLATRVARLEDAIKELTRSVRVAMTGRRKSLELQTRSLIEIETELSS